MRYEKWRVDCLWWHQSSLSLRRLLPVVFSPSVTEAVKTSPTLSKWSPEMIDDWSYNNLMCHFYMHCQPSPCSLHTRLKHLLLPKHFFDFISQFAGSFHWKTKDREFRIKVRFGYNSWGKKHCKAVTAFLVSLEFNMGVLSVLRSGSHDFWRSCVGFHSHRSFTAFLFEL